MLDVILTIVVVALIFGGFYYWARRQGLVTTEPAEERGSRRISLLTEAVAYVGAILLLAGGIAAISQQWNSLGDWGQVGVLAGAAAFLLLAGIMVRRVREPAIQRLVGVVWFLSAACVGAAAGFAANEVSATSGAATVLAAGVAGAVYAAALWLVQGFVKVVSSVHPGEGHGTVRVSIRPRLISLVAAATGVFSQSSAFS